MPDLSILYDLIPKLLPCESLHLRFMQQALVGLLLLAPMVALMGVQVVNFRMAFFADAISHSAFTGVALGLIFAVSPQWTMPVFGLLVGLAIVVGQRRSALSTDTVIGVFFSGVVAFGLAVVSRDKNADGGFASKENLANAKSMGIKDAMFAKKRGLGLLEMVKSHWVYKKLRNFRAGIEAAISRLKCRFGLDRCNWRGWAGFQQYVWSAIVSYNVLVLGRLLAQPR